MIFFRNFFSWNYIPSSHRLMFTLVLFLGVLNFLWGEKVPAGGGFGWDGVNYANMVRNFDSIISEGKLGSYYSQRILPSAAVRAMLISLGVSMNDLNIIRGFEFYNLMLLLGACCIWKRVADSFSVSLAGRWIGFSGIFINFAYSKQAFYYPVLTDVTALFVAMLLLLFYTEKRPIALFITTIMGAFCWPVVSVSGAFLLLFLKADMPAEVVKPMLSSFKIKKVPIARFVALSCLVVLVMSVVGYLLISQVAPLILPSCDALNGHYCFLEKFLNKGKSFLTVLPALFFMLVALVMLAGSFTFFKTLYLSIRKTELYLVGLALAAVLVPILLVKVVSNPAIANPSSLSLLFHLAIFPQEGKFLLPFISIAVFWGPVVLLLFLYWKEFCIKVRLLGPGIMAIVGMSLPLALVGEPRFMIVAWPFLVLGVVLAMESVSTKASFKYAFIFLTILYAQFWMKINLAPWVGGEFEGLQEFPKQIYFMHYGLWMGWWAYCVQFVVILLSVLWLRKTIVKV